MHTVQEIIDHFGSKAELARQIGRSAQSLTRWEPHGIPAKAAIEIERITKGKFKAVKMPLYSDRDDKHAA